MEHTLRDQNSELHRAAHAKDQFLARMSHELRTPLNGIIGFSELLIDGLPGEINAEQREYLDDILSSGRHLLQLINDILDLAKVQSGKMRLHPQRFQLSAVVDEVCSVMRPLALKKSISLTGRVSPPLQDVTLDPQRVKQILYNLISNAVKFTDDSGTVSVEADVANAAEIVVRVSDSGIGIEPENLSRLFREFEQLEDGVNRRYGGTGLGLALTQKLVEMHGGRITAESTPGKGSTFVVMLPTHLRSDAA
jgi:signal transduction histidine kinase